MRLQIKLVAVRKIQSNVPRSDFSAANLEQAAQAILQSAGTINPLILRQLDWQSYQVVSDHFGYYAAVRARELDLATGEMIQAIILEPENEGAILDQLQFFRNTEPINPMVSRHPNPDDPVATPSIHVDDLAPLLHNLERNLITQIQAIQPPSPASFPPMLESLEQRLMAKIEAMQKQQETLQQQMTALIEAIQTPHPPPPPSPTIPPIAPTTPKINLNTATITDLCLVKGLGKQKAQAIIARREAQGPFTDLQELIEIAGITPNTLSRYRFGQYLTVG